MNLHSVVQFLYLLVARFEKTQSRKNAAQLTFVTLFAIVPLMTSGYVLATWLPWSSGFSDQFQSFIFQHFIPSSGELIQGYLKNFSDQAMQLTWLGLGILLFSAVSLMLTIEGAFNGIWRVKSKRVGMRIAMYWLMLLLGPILLAAGFVISSYLLSSHLWLESLSGIFKDNFLFIRFSPIAISALTLSLMYYFLPSCKVRFTHALIGALIAASVLEAGKSLFVYLVSLTPSYKIVYGAFAMVPLFLLWLYIAWSVVLLGAQVVAMLPFTHKKWRGINASQIDWALMILKFLNQFKSVGVSRVALISELSFINSDDWEPVLALSLIHISEPTRPY